MLNKGLGSWIHKRRVKSGADIALILDDYQLSYAQLATRIDRLAAVFAERGVTSGTRVAFLGGNHPAFLETLFACNMLGAIFVPLNVRLAPVELNYALNDSGSQMLICLENLDDQARLALQDSSVREYLTVSNTPEAPSEYETALHASSGNYRDTAVSLEDASIILYTSGTTGKPKGAVLTHQNLTWNSLNVLVDYDVTSKTVALLIAPLFHTASLGMGALPVLLKGGTLVLQERFVPAEVLQAIEKHGVTSLSGVPTTYQLLAEDPAWAQTDISTLKMLTCGGSAVPVRVLEAYEARGLGFSGGYGMTETSPGATSLRAEHTRAKMGSAGLPHFFTSVRIVDGLGADLPAGEVGEILISGPNVIKEYWQRPDATESSYYDGGWFRSGDMGYLDEDGYLFISDRLKDMIISGGENIYPAEVEQAIMEIPEVESVAVIGVSDEKWGEVPWAVLVLKEGAELDTEALINHLNGRLARYKIPRTAVFTDSLPRTASGKIRKAELRNQFGAAQS
ncbi:o-succinylbenzoate--CoA ligase [Glutamicibacter uratoxydans]|uniref:o-succinylbenzoate--CoA ligase n=1 Tax=Glutamicibacter uratoxydans TaxID=43667 RepID=UPI003D6F276F